MWAIICCDNLCEIHTSQTMIVTHNLGFALTCITCWLVSLSHRTDMKAFGIVLDRHIHHLLSTELAVTLACSLILSWLDYCNSVLYSAPASSIQVLQWVQNNAARIVLLAPRRFHAQPLLRELHWLPVQHRIEYKVAVLTFKSRSSATALTYLSRHIEARISEQTLRSSAVPLLDKPFTRTDFSRRAFRCSVPTVWNSLPETIISTDSLSVFKSRLKTYFFNKAFD